MISKHRSFWISIGLLLTGLALRSYNLDLRALWFDEGITLMYAPLRYFENARMASVLVDVNPFVYRRLTWVWTLLIGKSIWSIRLFSVWVSVLLIAVVYRLTLDLTKRPLAAAFAATLTTVSPILIYYSQEAKGYSLIALAATTLLLCLNRIYQKLQRQQTVALGYWLLAVLCIGLGMGSHYIFAFLLVTLNTAIILHIIFKRNHTSQRFLLRFLGVQTLVACFLLPFVWVTFMGVTGAVSTDQIDQNNLNTAAAFFGRHAVDFTQGPFTGLPADCMPQQHDYSCGYQPQPNWALGIGMFLVTLAGILIGVWQLRWQRWVALAIVIVPVLLGYAFTQFNTFFFPRFLLYTVPVQLVLFGTGLYALSKRSRLAALGIVAAFVALSITPTRTLYATDTRPDFDWQPLAAQIAPLVDAGDGAVHVWVWVPGYLYSYLPDNGIDYKLAHFTPETRPTELTDFIASKNKVWLFDWITGPRDPINDNAKWLLENTAFVYETNDTTAYANLFIPPHAVDNAGEATEQVTFANGLTLNYAAIDVTKQAGDPFAVELHWDNPGTETPYKVFLHITAADGFVLAQQDGEPRNSTRPFNTWIGDLTEWKGTLLPSDLAAGTYFVNVGIYDPATGNRILTDTGAEFIRIGQLTLTP